MGQQSQKKQQVRVEVVDASSDGQRIDNFLLKHLKGVPKSHLYKLMRTGQLRVNGKRIKPGYKLATLDEVRIPPVRHSEKKSPSVPDKIKQLLVDRLLHEDEQVLIVDKPAGLSVHRGSGVEFGLIDALKSLRGDAGGWELVHRLDRDTSGCLIIAKSRQSLLAAQQLFRDGNISKQYLALTRGRWAEDHRTVNLALSKNNLQGGERMVIVDPDGKIAVTHFDVVERFPVATLVRATIETGRTHQIRVHAQKLGHPLAGDKRYGDKLFNAELRKRGLKRLFLHAARLQFTLGKPIDVQCPLPVELEEILAKLKT